MTEILTDQDMKSRKIVLLKLLASRYATETLNRKHPAILTVKSRDHPAHNSLSLIHGEARQACT